MGLFDILGTIGSIATGVSSIFDPQPKAVQPAGPAPAAAVSILGGTTAVAGGGKLTSAGIKQAISTGAIPTPAGAVGVSGAGAVFTRTLVQRIERATGNVLSEDIKKGSPFLMRSEVRALKRVTKMIRKADGKIPRRQAKVSDEALRKAVLADIQQLSLIQGLTHHNGHHGT